MEIGLKVMEGDEAFYYQYEDGELKGVVIIFVDVFTLAGTEEFVDNVLEIVNKELTVSKIERDNFRHMRVDVAAKDDGIEIQMEDYVESLEDIKEIRKADREDDLIKLELKEYRKLTGKLAWLANSTDLSYTAL